MTLARCRTAQILIAGTLLMSLAACLQPTEASNSSVSLQGRWQYSAVETGLSGSKTTGTLTIGQQSGASFQGSLEVSIKRTETGEARSLTGNISGSAPSAVAIDFDAQIEQSPRRHVAHLSGEMLTGTWIRVSDQGVSASGTFSAQLIR